MSTLIVDGQPVSGISIPAGMVLDYAGATPPSGWLLCDGAAVSRTTYAALFAAVGVTWGVGDGATTFNLPDLRRRTTVGSGGTGSGTLANTLGATGGAETHTLGATEMPVHTHGVSDPGHSHTAFTNNASTISAGNVAPPNFIKMDQSNTGGSVLQVNVNSNGTGIGIANAGGGLAHNNLQPSAVMHKIIKT